MCVVQFYFNALLPGVPVLTNYINNIKKIYTLKKAIMLLAIGKNCHAIPLLLKLHNRGA